MALSSSNRVAVVDVASRAVTTFLQITAQDPRALAVAAGRLYVVPFESNNQTQLSGCWPENIDGELCTFDARAHVTEAPDGNAQSLSLGYVADIVRHPDIPDRDLYVFDTATDELVEVVDTLGTLLYGVAADSAGRVFIAQTEARNDANGKAGTEGHGMAELENRAFLNRITRVSCGAGCGAPAFFELEPLPPRRPRARRGPRHAVRHRRQRRRLDPRGHRGGVEPGVHDGRRHRGGAGPGRRGGHSPRRRAGEHRRGSAGAGLGAQRARQQRVGGRPVGPGGAGGGDHDRPRGSHRPGPEAGAHRLQQRRGVEHGHLRVRELPPRRAHRPTAVGARHAALRRRLRPDPAAPRPGHPRPARQRPLPLGRHSRRPLRRRQHRQHPDPRRAQLRRRRPRELHRAPRRRLAGHDDVRPERLRDQRRGQARPAIRGGTGGDGEVPAQRPLPAVTRAALHQRAHRPRPHRHQRVPQHEAVRQLPPAAVLDHDQHGRQRHGRPLVARRQRPVEERAPEPFLLRRPRGRRHPRLPRALRLRERPGRCSR